MKITEENLSKLRYSSRTGKWYKDNNTYIKHEACSACGEPYLKSISNKGTTCSPACRRRGLEHSEETKRKISRIMKKKYADSKDHPWYGRHHTEESKAKMSRTKKGTRCGKDNHNWNGGYKANKLSGYAEHC